MLSPKKTPASLGLQVFWERLRLVLSMEAAMLTRDRTPLQYLIPTRYRAHYRNHQCSEVNSV
jgi:hypothetical protein